MPQPSQCIETLISSLGGRGKFQILIHLLVSFTYIPLVFNHIIMAFHGTKIPHTCMAGKNLTTDDLVSDSANQSTTAVFRYITNITHGECSSKVLYSNGDSEVVKCVPGQWEYDPDNGEKNIVSEFDLVCDRAHLSSLATTIYFLGVMIGGLLFGDLADRFGRLPVVLATLYGSMVVGFITAFSDSYAMFALLRFLHGILIQGLQTSGYTLLMELFQAKHRPFAGVVVELFFSSGIMILAGLAYGLRNWRHLQIVISLVPLVTVFYPWVIPESLRWLIMKEKMEKAEKQIERICKMNKIPYPSECWGLLKQTSREQGKTVKQYNFSHLFRSSTLLRRSLISFYIWLAVSMNYYGMTFLMTSFKGSRYLNFFISGLLETISFALTLPILNRFGRKKPLFGGFFISAVMCISAGCIQILVSDLDTLVTALAVMGKSALSCIFVIFFVFSAELYPTVMRNIGIGAGMFFARFGSVLAPKINQWSLQLIGVSGIFVFGGLSLVAALVSTLLPETHKKQLPDSVEDEDDADGSGIEMDNDLEMTAHNGHVEL